MKRVFLFILIGIILAVESSYCQENITQSPWEKGSGNYTKEDNLADLREFHEGTLFLLKRYATLEALVTARQQKRLENESFAIGTASLLPGAGQMINQDYVQGGLLLFTTMTSWGTVQQLNFTKQKKGQYDQVLPWYYTALVIRNGIMTYAMLHASNAHFREHQNKSSAIWTGMSSLLPGVGQAINNDWWSAAGMVVAWSLATVWTSDLEDKIYFNSNDNYLVEKDSTTKLSLACLPGGVMLDLTHHW